MFIYLLHDGQSRREEDCICLAGFYNTEYTGQSQDGGDTPIDSVTLPCVSVQKEDETTWNSSFTTRIRMMILILNLVPKFTMVIFVPQLEKVPTHTAFVCVTAPA